MMIDKYLHVRCSAHIINLIVKEGLKEQSDSIHRIRLAMRFVKSSPQRSKKFQECVLFEKIDCKKGVCLDVDTRWNSTYLMLEVAIKYRKAFDRLKREDNCFVPYFESLTPPDKADWAKIESFVKFLKLFYDSTLALSGSNYVTCAQFFVQIVVMHLTINRFQTSLDIVMRKMVDNMRGKFEKYWVHSSLKNNLCC